MIRRFAFEDLKTGWKLAPVEFSERNLLVGLSGVGKSRILDALSMVSFASLGGNACRWELELELQGSRAIWRVETGPGPSPEEPTAIRRESLDWDSERVLDYDPSGGTLRGSERIPAMNVNTTLLATFRASDTRFEMVSDCVGSFRRIASSTRREYGSEPQWHGRHDLDGLRARRGGLRAKAHRMRAEFPGDFLRVVQRYSDIFPDVEEVRVGFHPLGEPNPLSLWQFEVRERGVAGWMGESDLSSGMLRTLVHLFDLELLPSHSVLLVDEVETSLGMNCVAAVSDALWNQRARDDIQVIATSHHPYILNTIPRMDWKVVTREGSLVTVTPASEIPELATRSAQDSFTLLQRYYDRAQDTALRLVP